MANVTNTTSSQSTTQLVMSTTEVYTTLETTEEPIIITIFGRDVNLRGMEIMLFYVSLNIIILMLILILACRSGAVKTREKKKEKEQRRKEREEAKMRQFQEQHRRHHGDDDDEEQKHAPVEIQLSVKQAGRAHSVQSEDEDDRSSYRDREDMMQQMHGIHGRSSTYGHLGAMKTCCGAFVTDIMGRWFIYSAFLVHVWDQGSDLGVIYTWFDPLDPTWQYLGWISVGVLINYRLFSAYSLRRAQRGWRDTVLQVFDFQLFVDVYRSFEDVKPTDGLYWIRAMEAVLESCPQLLLQFVYLYQETSLVVWVSLFGSLASVIFSLLHYTDVVFTFDDEDDDMAISFCEMLWVKIRWYVAYGTRFLFRLCEVTSRCMVLALIWTTWADTYRISWFGALIVGCILGLELVFYGFLTQFRIPPWEIAAFLITDIDLTLTFEGREGALTKPLEHNILYTCFCKPVGEMFTKITNETEEYYEEHYNHNRDKSHVHQNKFRATLDAKQGKMHRSRAPKRQKLLIAPAHYVYRFLESVFELFCVITYGVVDQSIREILYVGTSRWILAIATVTTILTPILYCTVRAFADEGKTLERNLIALVLGGMDTHEIMRLIGAGASLKEKDYEGNNIVHACVLKNNVELLRRILRRYKKKQHSVEINAVNKNGYTPLLLAAQCGSLDCLKLFYHEKQENRDDLEIDFNAVHIHNGRTIVQIATAYDQHEAIEFLASINCDLHATFTFETEHGVEINGYNACHVAARYNAFQSLDVLIANGVDFKAKLSNGDTCAILAASRGHLIILQKLFDAGDNFNRRGNFGHTPLYRAAINNHPGTVLVLGRDFAANPNIPDENNVSVVVQAFKARKFGVLQSLAEVGCRFDGCVKDKLIEVEIRDPESVDDKLSALMWACKYHHAKLVKTLLDSGADPNHRNKLEETAAHHAAAMGALDCLKLLYAYKANLLWGNGLNQTARDKAKEQHQRKVIEWMDEMNIKQ